MKQTLLIVDDEPAARYGMSRALEREGYSVVEAESIEAARTLVDRSTPDIVLLDVKLATGSGLDYLPELSGLPNAPVIIMVTAHGNERLAVESIKRGAFDYLPKPFEVDDLRLMVRNAAEVARLRRENIRLKRALTAADGFGELIGSSAPMKRVYSLIEKVADTPATVMITGESGTGKEMVAREIHNRSGRSGSFVALNCAAMPADLIESELFGFEKGAFTGAANRRIGKFESAHGGTLFLDEVGDMSLSTQAKFLRVLEERSFQRLGGNEEVPADVRIVSATNKDLEHESGAARFREDLYYRLCVLTIEMPPLRGRKQDIPALAASFCERFGRAYKQRDLSLSASAAGLLLAYDWPGNVRQLRNAIEHAVVLTDGDEIELDSLPRELKRAKSPVGQAADQGTRNVTVSLDVPYRDARKMFERLYIEKCLESTGGNITAAADLLGVHRQSLQHKIKELGLTKKFSVDS